MLQSSSYELWGNSTTGSPISLTRFIIAMKFSEGLSASRSTSSVTFSPEVKQVLQNIKKGSEFKLLWGYSSSVYRKVSIYWVGTEWNVGGSNTVVLSFVNLGQYQLSRGNQQRVIITSNQPLTDIAKSKGVMLKGEVRGPKAKAMSQVPVKEILKDNKDAFIKWGWDPNPEAEIVAFSELGSKAQVHYIDTLKGFVGEIKITYAAQLPKDTSFVEVLSKGSENKTTANSPSKPPMQRASDTNRPDPSSERGAKVPGLWSYCVINATSGLVTSSSNSLVPPEDGTSMLKLFIALVLRKQIMTGLYSISSTWENKPLTKLLELMLDKSENPAANSLIARIGGLSVLNKEVKALGFQTTGFKSLYGKPTKTGKITLRSLNWQKYSVEAKAAKYLERYGEASALYPEVSKALVKMRADSGFPLTLISGFRGFASQEQIWLSKSPATRANFSAPPGYSQHHTGLAIDLVSVSDTPSANELQQLQWLKANANRYGFILPYGSQGSPAPDLGPGLEPWHFVWVGNAAAMSIFHDFISRAKNLGYDPLANALNLQALFESPESLSSDKTSNSYELCKAMQILITASDPVAVVMKKFLEGSYVGFAGETYAKLGYTSKIIGATIAVEQDDGFFIISAYANTSDEEVLKRGIKEIFKASIGTKLQGTKSLVKDLEG
jgi:D-alanyl-D-alanine carboxypeptidase/Beta-lactamase enzyme family